MTSNTGHTIPESQLIKLCVKGDRPAQKELYNRYKTAMFNVCRRYAQCEEDAQDMFQESMIKVFKSIDQYRGDAALGAWIKRVVINTCLNHIRKNKKKNDLQDSIGEANDPVDLSFSIYDELNAEALLKMVQKLPTPLQTVFNMYAIEGYSHKEICDALDITMSNSKIRLSRARKILQEVITKALQTN